MICLFQHTAARRRLDPHSLNWFSAFSCFNTQPPEGGWLYILDCAIQQKRVSTHSRPKAAGDELKAYIRLSDCFNTQPPEGGWKRVLHSPYRMYRFQHTAARRRLVKHTRKSKRFTNRFQHTAARRRLVNAAGCASASSFVSTHSRPKAAGWSACRAIFNRKSFNTQPPEGGWSLSQKPCSIRFRSPDFARLPRKARTRV